MNKISELFTKSIIWQSVKDEKGKWHTNFNGERYELHINDFPDEPLYTITFKEEAMDFDDKPTMWFIPMN